MTLIVETGAGVRLANSYVTAAYITAYLTERERETAWIALTADLQAAAAIAATDYIEKVHGPLFMGVREFFFDEVEAEASIDFTGLPVALETLTLGDVTYTFVGGLTLPPVPNEVVIGGSAAATASNLRDAIFADPGNSGITYGEGTQANRHAASELIGGVVWLFATAPGEGGNGTVLTEAATNVTLTPFAGGLDGGSQPLSFPRSYLYDYGGRAVLGIPRKLREATAEYASRASITPLDPDPLVDPTLASVQSKREKVGPIEEETVYATGTHLVRITVPYPAADRLLAEYKAPAGVIRA